MMKTQNLAQGMKASMGRGIGWVMTKELGNNSRRKRSIKEKKKSNELEKFKKNR